MADRAPLCTVKACPHWKEECPFGWKAIRAHSPDEPFSLSDKPRPDCLWPEPEGTDNDT